ncbi:MAG: hypothetical protein V8R52_04405 [Coprobacter fastidiosus]
MQSGLGDAVRSFPGMLQCIRCGKFIKDNYPDIRVEMGGGFASTELRQLSDVRVFEYVDFITLDDGETPFYVSYWSGMKRVMSALIYVEAGEVRYLNNPEIPDVPMRKRVCPIMQDCRWINIFSVIEVAPSDACPVE